MSQINKVNVLCFSIAMLSGQPFPFHPFFFRPSFLSRSKKSGQRRLLRNLPINDASFLIGRNFFSLVSLHSLITSFTFWLGNLMLIVLELRLLRLYATISLWFTYGQCLERHSLATYLDVSAPAVFLQCMSR